MAPPKDETGVRPYTPKPGETFADVARQNSEELERSKVPSPNKAKIQELHNKTAGLIVASIVKPMIAVGGQGADVLLLLESVIVGTMIVTTVPDADDKMLALIAAGVGPRLKAAREKIKADAVLDAAFPAKHTSNGGK